MFLAFSRQIQQISTDYDVLDATLEHLQRESQWYQDHIETSMQHEVELRVSLQETINSFLREAKLIRTYSNLYNERSKIGVSEGFAMVNQRDAEVCKHRSRLIASPVSLTLPSR